MVTVTTMHVCVSTVLCVAVVLWDLSEVLDDTLTCAYMKQVRRGTSGSTSVVGRRIARKVH